MELPIKDWGDIIHQILFEMISDPRFLAEENVIIDSQKYDYNIFEQPEDY